MTRYLLMVLFLGKKLKSVGFFFQIVCSCKGFLSKEIVEVILLINIPTALMCQTYEFVKDRTVWCDGKGHGNVTVSMEVVWMIWGSVWINN